MKIILFYSTYRANLIINFIGQFLTVPLFGKWQSQEQNKEDFSWIIKHN